MKLIKHLSLALGLGACAAVAASTHEVSITIDARGSGPVISEDVYGQFAEHLGNGIYGGIWVGEDSDIPNTRGIRDDVVAALKAIHVPVVRWPGGCFADEYHWRDGIGPRDQRPATVNSNWGGVAESNAFGTHEFLDFVGLVGAKAYINGNLGTGSVREMAEWLAYMTADDDSTLARERRKNGRQQPWEVAYFGIGNEAWGCGGHMTPEYYADLYKRYASFLKAPPGREPRLIASGFHSDQTIWTDYLSAHIPPVSVAGISHHYYTLPTGDWDHKGEATGFDQAAWFSTLERAYRMDAYIRANVAVLDRNDPQGDIGLIIDEWGTWYDPRPGGEPGLLYQQNTLRDALVAALTFNIFHQHAGRVRMANIAQMVNVLQAMILTDGKDMLLTPTYHVFGMYQVFQNATVVPFEIDTDRYDRDAKSLPAVTASAARDKSGRMYLALVNLDPENPAAIHLRATGAAVTEAVGQLLTADALDAHNTFQTPNRVKPVAFTAPLAALELPAKSILVVSLR